MIVGVAEVDVVPVSAGFESELKDQTSGGLASFSKDAEVAGADAGANLRGGVQKDASKIENDLAEAGAASGGSFRKGVTGETGKLGEDLEADGTKAGAGLERGASSGLSKLAGAISTAGLPLGGFSAGLEKSAGAAEHAEKSTGGFAESLGGAAGPLAAVGVAAVVGAGYAVHLAEGMESADTAIATAAGTTEGAAKKIGDSFLKMKGEFSGEEIAAAYAEVAGQLKSAEGHVLSTAEADKVMAATTALAEAKQISLGEATAATAKILQAFGLDAGDAGHVTDVLFTASNATGQSVEGLATQLTKVRSKLGDTSGSVGDLAGLLVDMTDHGVTGKAAMTGLNTGLNTLLKTSDGVATAAAQQNSAYDAMTPKLKGLAKEYEHGAITSSEFKKQTEGLPAEQATLAENFGKASTAVQSAQLKYKEMGLTVFDSQGKFVGMGSIIDQLGPRFAKMSQQQQIATATTLFGAGAAKQMTAVIDAGPAAYDKATGAVQKHGTAESAAAKQADTLHGETKQLSATMTDLGTRLGTVLIPVVTAFAGILLKLIPVTEQVVSFIKSHWMLLPAIMDAPITITIAAYLLLKSKLESIFTSVVGFVKGAWHTVETDAEDAVHSVEGFFSPLPGKLEGYFHTVENDVSGVWHEVAGDASRVPGEIAGFFDKLPGEILSTISHLPSEMESAGASVAQGFAHGVESEAGKIESTIKSTIEAPIDAVKNALGINSPSKVTEEHGKSIADGYAEGIKKDAPKAMSAAMSVAQQIVKFWEEHGFSKAAGAGFAGNAAQESSDNPDEPGGGLYQQSGYPASYGEGSVANQSAHVLENLPASLVAALKSIGDPAQAANLIAKDYERPKGSQPGEEAYADIANIAHREAAAREAFGSGGGVGQDKSQAKTATEQKAALDKQVAQQKAALADWVARTTASVADGTKAQKAAVAQEIAERKATVAKEIADEKAGMSVQQAQQKEEEKKRTSDKKAGESVFGKLQTAVQEGSLKSLNTQLNKTHTEALNKIEKSLDGDHKAALAKLSAELVKVHKEALEKQASLEKAERAKAEEESATHNREAYEAKEKRDQETREEYKTLTEKAAEEQTAALVASIEKQATISSDTASNAAQAIADSTKVTLDKQAEAGLSGTAEIAARLQTVLDEVTAESDTQIGAAKLAEDETVGKGAIAEAEAASRLSAVESAAKLREAEAQAKLELASKAPTTTPTAATPAGGDFNFNFYGANPTPAEMMAEVTWKMKTGALPQAAATAPPVPA
jgi:Phage-related minor tail protein